jgi:serine/threonine protein kinase
MQGKELHRRCREFFIPSIAPELLNGNPSDPSFAVDVFAFGSIIYELFARKKNGLPRVRDKVDEQKTRAHMPSDTPPEIIELLFECVRFVYLFVCLFVCLFLVMLFYYCQNRSS